jgi:hypothetical protein
MRIYYFGELIEDTNKKTEEKIEQTQLHLKETDQKIGMPSLADILKEIDLSLDTYNKNTLQGA